jgi:hypothetical protein
MDEFSGASPYQSGDPVSVEIAGEWIDGEYVGFVLQEGHVVYIGQGKEILSTRIRARGGLYA